MGCSEEVAEALLRRCWTYSLYSEHQGQVLGRLSYSTYSSPFMMTIRPSLFSWSQRCVLTWLYQLSEQHLVLTRHCLKVVPSGQTFAHRGVVHPNVRSAASMEADQSQFDMLVSTEDHKKDWLK